MKKRWLALGVGVFVAAIFLAIRISVRDTSPLGIGSTPDEAWTYVHTSAAWGSSTPNLFGIAQKHRWTADGAGICRETEFRWRRGMPFATRTTTFYFGTNTAISRISSQWKYAFLSPKTKGTPAPVSIRYFGGFGTNSGYPYEY